MVQMSPQIAGATAGAAGLQGLAVSKGVAQLGQALANTGQDISGIMLETQRANDDTTIAKAKNRWLDEELAWNDKINTDPQNPLKWGEYRDNGMEKLHSFNSGLDLSPDGQRKMEAEWTNWRGSASRNVDRLSQKKVFNNNISTNLVLRDRLVDQGKFGEAREVVNSISGQLDPAVAMKLQDKINDDEKEYTLNESMATDALQLNDDISAGKYDGMFKTEADKKDWSVRVDRAARNLEVEQYSDVIEGVMLKDIKTEDDIDALIHPKTSQSSRLKYNNFLIEHNDAQLQQRIKTPEYQRGLRGRLLSMIDSYDNNSTTFDEDKYMFMSEVSKVSDDAMRNEMKEAFKRKENQEDAWQSAGDKVISRAIQTGQLSPPKLEPVKVTYHEYIVDGNLGEEKLKALTNLDDGQIKKIQRDLNDGNPKEAVKKYGIYMRRLGRGMFKKPIGKLSQWENDFYYGLTNQSAPPLGSVAHTTKGDAAHRDAFRRSQEKYDARLDMISREMKTFFGDKKNIDEKDVNEQFRKLDLFFSDEYVDDLLEEERKKRISSKKLSVNHTPDGHKPSLAQRRAGWKQGKVFISLDTNWAEGVEATQPLVVVPDDASEQMIDAASRYASEMAKIHRDEFGRTNFKPRVVTRSENGRGSDRPDAQIA